MFEDTREEADGNAMFSVLIRYYRPRLGRLKKSSFKRLPLLQKKLRKKAKLSAKEEAQLTVEQRRGDREKTRISREKAKIERQKKFQQDKADRLAGKQLQEDAKNARIQDREQKKLSQKGSKKKSLVVVLKYRSNVTWREIDDIEPAANQQPPRRALRHKK